jgi:glucosamine--fructose-6-phosphate aminotransferase (isomerizing)
MDSPADSLPVAERTMHPFLTHDMIFEIPGAIEATLHREEGRFAETAASLRNRRSLMYTGCGTAFFAAMLGEHVLNLVDGSPVRSWCVQAFDLLHYEQALDAQSGVIAVSHSGITKTTVDAVRLAAQRGAFSVGITHFEDRPIAAAADRTLVVGNGPDRSRCHTKCYLASAVAASELGLEVWKSSGGRMTPRLKAVADQIESLPGLTSTVLREVERGCEQLAEDFVKARVIYFVGTGPSLPTMLEAALKIKETSFMPAEGMQTEQLLHGPWVSLDAGSPVFVLAPKGPSRTRSADLLKAARALSVPTVAIVTRGDRELASLAGHVVEIPETDEYLSAFLSVIPLYLFAYYSSVKRGHNPDQLRYLDPAYWGARQTIFPPGTH